jgi:hypothetical protein
MFVFFLQLLVWIYVLQAAGVLRRSGDGGHQIRVRGGVGGRVVQVADFHAGQDPEYGSPSSLCVAAASLDEPISSVGNNPVDDGGHWCQC